MAPAARARELAAGSLLAALALLIPLAFRGWLQVTVGPATYTLASHVPSMLSMFISPFAAALVGLGSTLGFLVTLGPVVAARAFTHVLFGVAGALLVRRGASAWTAILAALPVHALGEGLVVYAYGVLPSGLTVTAATVGFGLHHVVDGAIAVALLRVLQRAGLGPAVGLAQGGR